MARLHGSGKLGPTRSVRLPVGLDGWFWERLELKPEMSASELLISLVHGGLRLRDGYMSVHRAALERLQQSGSDEAVPKLHRLFVRHVSGRRTWNIWNDGLRPTPRETPSAKTAPVRP